MKYRVLTNPGGYDTFLVDDEFSTVDEAVKMAMEYHTNFIIVQIVDWSAKEVQSNGE